MSSYPIKLASIILTVKSAHSIFRQILAHKISGNILTDKYRKCFEQIYHGRNVAVERRSNFPRRNGEWNFVSRLEFFYKYPTRPWYIWLITPNIHLYLDVCVYIKKRIFYEFLECLTVATACSVTSVCHICCKMYMWRHQTDRKNHERTNKIWREGTREGNKEKSKNADTALQRVKMAIFIEQILRSHTNRCKFNLVAR